MKSYVLAAIIAACGVAVGGCHTTSMQSSAELDRPAHPVGHIAVVAPPTLVVALASDAARRGVIIEDGNAIVPPTRQHSDAEIRKILAAHGIDGVLVVTVAGDTEQRYAGTIMSGSYSGISSANGVVPSNTISGTSVSSGTATATPRHSRTVAFQARLTDLTSGRNLWVGGGQTRAGGTPFMIDAVSAGNAASAILNDLQAKGLVGAVS
jgi:hypothetical protein